MGTILVAGVVLVICPFLSGQTLPVVQVEGAPFSANEVELQNAKPNVRNVIPMKTIAVYRDSAGRTRIEVSVPPDPAGNPNIVIDDPVANVTFMIDEKHKFARRLTWPTPREIPSVGDDQKSIEKPVTPIFSKMRNVNVQTASESLGSQLIEGLVAEGKRVTSESPQNSSGCGKSIVENWYSPDLWMTLVQKRSNCLGDSSTHLENIQRSEPDPRLFQVPADYMLVEQEWNKPPAQPPSSLK
jgi:hypothetical protein